MQSFSLFWILTWVEFKGRYYGSVLGYFWSLMKPVVMFLVLYFVFGVLARWEADFYQLQLLLGIILWNFFAEATGAGMRSFFSKAHILKKISVGKFLILLSTVSVPFLTVLLNFVAFFLIAVFVGWSFSWSVLLLPFLLILLFCFVFAVSLFLSVVNVYLRDLAQIWDLILQAGFFLTPVFYPFEAVPAVWRNFFLLNPMTWFVDFSRQIVIYGEVPSWKLLFILCFGVLCFLAVAVIFFNKYSRRVIEKI